MCQVHWSLGQDHPIPFPSSPLRYLLVAESFFCFLQSMAKGGRLPSNEVLLEQLRNGTAQFELLPTPVPLSAPDVRFFARIGSSLGGGVSPATKKVERYAVHKITGDGRCMFRALVKGMANYKGLALSLRQEKDDADELRMAVKEIICDNETERRQYEEALIAITVDESLKQYCQRIGRSDFWGGESELLVLSKLCRQPIIVYIPEHEDGETASQLYTRIKDILNDLHMIEHQLENCDIISIHMEDGAVDLFL
ncbi:OVARIAN TUMOR DOMAIN-containing deubiquitinating enzyme 3-like isoform X2 [Zingiber officinale]|uniref:OVARIAN TUMOR DOMAIN-containing deubiquitinating enzyme 3-like isoform X2 n=1 Tax=Zingiber officinale TaxID=94328 RepID=UPI001C4D19DA|nr:OVARIAN TUMOR DOMAIN-containing deubiquitinating enzyme 3-like isoform X2 [Zingiber officinale]